MMVYLGRILVFQLLVEVVNGLRPYTLRLV